MAVWIDCEAAIAAEKVTAQTSGGCLAHGALDGYRDFASPLGRNAP